jgi:hypothetical protein
VQKAYLFKNMQRIFRTANSGDVPNATRHVLKRRRLDMTTPTNSTRSIYTEFLKRDLVSINVKREAVSIGMHLDEFDPNADIEKQKCYRCHEMFTPEQHAKHFQNCHRQLRKCNKCHKTKRPNEEHDCHMKHCKYCEKYFPRGRDSINIPFNAKDSPRSGAESAANHFLETSLTIVHTCGVLGAVFWFPRTFMTPTQRLVRSENANSAKLARYLWNSSIHTRMGANSKSVENAESHRYLDISLMHTRQNAGADAPGVASAYQAPQISLMHTWPNSRTDVAGAVKSVYPEMSAMPPVGMFCPFLPSGLRVDFRRRSRL